MKTILALAFTVSVLAVAPAFANPSAADGLCGPDGPDSYKRAGGYCEQLGYSITGTASGDSIQPLEEPEVPDPCAVACAV
jgi:hypothetical protein